ncbi:hypothetical protein [Luteolibacter luteus]|uniref:Uncharacterized protein n=1 Tax=Luteolibacter luteus TaxID=2728835 RepID=A0A858RGD6_9BACT|nr:hypothetical protein [Luteolibacter luteus]QJE95907.1 hypothetical protein HHL09_08975 [Luteolibacter luteus]
MRSWFTWLLVFGVMAGLWGRVLSLDHQHGKKEVAACCDHDHSHDGSDSQGDAGDHGKDCPPWPHDHHHTCCHQAPLAGAEIPNPGLVPPGASWLGVTWSTALPPDEPVFALDKPPLI